MSKLFEVFFSEPNIIKWADFQIGNDHRNSWVNHANDWVSYGNKDTSLIVLPYKVSENEVTWYVATSNFIAAKNAERELVAFLGQSIPVRVISVADFEHANNIYTTLKEKFPGPMYKIVASTKTVAERIRNKLSIYLKVLLNRPKITRKTQKPFSQIRSDFELSILAGDEIEAKKSLTKLKETGRLTIENFNYLEIRLLVGLGDWEKFDLNLIRDIKNFRLPISVINDVAKYFFEVGIKQYLNERQLTNCKEQLIRKSFREFLGLFKKRFDNMPFETIYVYLLATIFDDNPDKEYQKCLIELLRKKQETSLFFAIDDVVKNQVRQLEVSVAVDISEVDNHINNFDYDRAVSVCLSLDSSKMTATKITQCLYPELPEKINQRDTEFLKEVINHLLNLNETDRAQLHQNVKTFEEEIIRIVDERSQSINKRPESWSEWVAQVKGGMTPLDSQNVLENHAKSWAIHEFISDMSGFEKFVEDLFTGEEDSDVFKCFDLSFPIIYECFILRDTTYSPKLNSLADKLLYAMALKDELPSETEKNIVFELQTYILKCDLKKSDYNSLLEYCRVFFEKLTSFKNVDWMIDIIENFTENQKADRAKFEELFSYFFSEVQRMENRLSVHQKSIIESLCKENYLEGYEFSKNNANQDDPEHDPLKSLLQGKHLGIYTLEENAGKRAKRIIESQVEDCRVSINSDKAGTPKLEELAKRADFLVCAWKASKHAATIFIEKFRSTEDIIKPSGKGSSSIINALLEQAA